MRGSKRKLDDCGMHCDYGEKGKAAAVLSGKLPDSPTLN
jgi:hypothetical protein